MDTSPPHTLETLLPLLGPDGNPASRETGDKLRILTAEADGYTDFGKDDGTLRYISAIPPSGGARCIIDCYSESIEAIFEAEKRLGLHTFRGYSDSWVFFAILVIRHFKKGRSAESADFAFLTAAQRCILFILTAQRIKEQKGASA